MPPQLLGSWWHKKRKLVNYRRGVIRTSVYLRCVGWMGGSLAIILFNSISAISGRFADGIERLCAMESRLRLQRSPRHVGLDPGAPHGVWVHPHVVPYLFYRGTTFRTSCLLPDGMKRFQKEAFS